MSGVEHAIMIGAGKTLASSLLSPKVYNFFSKWMIDTSLLDELEILLNMVEALLSDAEEKLIEDNTRVDKWAQMARFAIYDAEDFLDGILADVPGSNKVRTNLTDFFGSSNSVKDKLKNKLKDIHPSKKAIEEELVEIIVRLQSIAVRKDVLDLKEKHELATYRKGRLSTSLANVTSTICGRFKDKETIIRLINSREGNDDVLRVIPIVGMGGIGKTTLAGMVFHEYKSVDNNSSIGHVFEVKGWACVSNEFDATRVIKSLLESITGQESKLNNSLELLQQELKIELQGKRFLIVLDDLWSENPLEWDVLKTSFAVGAVGSRVIVTTRSKKVADIVCTCSDFFYALATLGEDESWSLFEMVVFCDGNSSAYPKLKEIGKEIVRKCKGLPLAIKMIGGLLISNGHDENEWRNVLNDKIWGNTNIIPSLKLSYLYLPLGVQSCFAYCSIFPKDYTFSMEEVIMLWIGEGLIKKFCEGNRYEDVARAYFTHLRSKFFFQESSSNGSKFVMHDLVHDLALHVSKGLCVDFRNINLESRRLSYLQGKDEPLLDNVSGIKLNHLRTFLPLRQNFTTGFYLKKKLLGELLSNFKLLRVLSLNGYHISTLPKSLGDMKLLRLLDLSFTQIDHLPDMICRLYNLQILCLSHCWHLKTLPAEICNLVNLRHLAIDGTRLEEMPNGIGRMRNIRTLSNFVIGRGKSNQMREFKKLLHLQGKLHISRLNYVEDANDVVIAGFKEKEYLEGLALEWEGTGEQDEQVLDAIEAHKNLKSLTIKGYGGKRLSDWIIGVSPSFAAMVSLCIIHCFNCEALPPLGNLPFLRNLEMVRLDRVESFGEEFYGDSDTNSFRSLEKLIIDDMKVLKTWCFPGGNVRVAAFQVLQDLQIRSCPQLTKIPYCFPSLSRLLIESCDNLVNFEMCGEEGSSSACRHHPFQSIHISSCPKLEEIPNNFVNSDSFDIDECETLVCVPRLQHVRKLTSTDVGVWSLPLEAAVLQECRDGVLEELIIQSTPSDLFSALLSKEVFTFFSTWGLDTSLLDQLETQLNSVQALLRDAEEKLIDKNDYVEEWAQKARFAIYDADDFVDKTLADVPRSNELRTNIINTIESSEYSTEDKIKSNVKGIVPAIHPSKKTIEEELGEIIERLQSLAAQRDAFGLKEKSERSLFTIGRPISINETFTIYGRSEDKHMIIRMLNSREGNDDALRVIPIIGRGGIGKTTLACLVFYEYKGLNRSFGMPSWLGSLVQHEDNRSSPHVFDVKGWICVSDEFDAACVIKSLLESITGQESKGNYSLKSFQHELKKQLQGKKFLIVLDDFWSNKPEDWEVLQTCFSVGALGSRVIITTRSTEVARIVTTTYNFFYELDKLSRDESWFLFEKIVFRDKNASKHLTLTDIGLDIVSRCNGLPMSIKMIGRFLLLKGNDEIEWRSVLNNKIWENSNIIPSIWLSYNDLPSGVRSCFACCSIFPKGYLFTMEEVTMLWIGEGLIEKFCEDKRYEDVARAYFTHLCSKLFFQESGSGRSEFVMHDLVHDLALHVSRELCVKLHNVTAQSRRLSYLQGREESLLNNMLGTEVRHLRTFLPLRRNGFPKNGEGFYFNNELFGNLLSNFKLLRVLSLNGYAISKLPDSVGDMKLLRYLDLSCTNIDYLSNKVCQLYNLRILFLSGCRNLRRLPAEICNLVNLRHLYIDGTNLEEMPDGIGKMTNIQTLSNYVVGGGKSKQMREFKELLNLQGKLLISKLNNVEDTNDVVVAGFKKKDYIEELVLEWEHNRARGTKLDDEKVLDAIDAHNNLKSLTIKWYGGKRLSDWIVGVSPSFTSMVSLCITDCSNCEALPSLGNLPFLKNLKIERLDRVESFGEEFYGDSHNPFQALEKLIIDDMKVLKTWWFPEGDRLGFQMLQDLQIVRCPELTKISYCFPSLSQLLIESCYNLFKFEMRGEAEGGSSSITARRHPFQSICIFSCPKLVEIPISFAKSDSFEIENCERLDSAIRFQHVRKLTLRDDSVSLPAEAALQDCRDEVMEESGQKCFACGFGCRGEVKKCACKMGTIIVPEIVPPPADDCLRLRKAFEGWGTDEEELILVMGHRNATQRKQIAEAYQDLYEESLLDRMGSELSGDFHEAVLLWLYDPAERDARLIREALDQKLAKQLEILVEVACTTPSTHLLAVRKAYCLLFHCSIEQDIRSKVPSTPLQKLLVGLVRYLRYDSGEAVDTNLAMSEAVELHKCIKARLFESDRFLWILSTRNIFQLRETFECYQRSFKNPIDQDIKRSGETDLEAVLSLVARCIHKPEMHFAEVIREAIIGLGTDEDSLTRAIVTRAEVDMVKIKSAYSEMYKSTVESAVAGDTSGYYRAFLMTLLGTNLSPKEKFNEV